MGGLLFAGISLGSILLLAALGLAITYGLMGVINMAHGELIMIGAYTTYVVQNLFRTHLPQAFDWYLVCALPAAFAVSALVGMVLERVVIRWLYGRPLETLLATWGISLGLIQVVRTIFGAQNVGVENPSWMSGGIQVLSNVVLPWSRVMIIAFAAMVLVGMWLLLTRTRLGLFVRGVTQNREMASCVRRADRTRRYVRVRTGRGNRGPRRVRASRRSATSARISAGLHRRFVHGRRVRRRWAARRHGLRGADARLREQVPRSLVGRGDRQDRGAGLHHLLHPAPAAGPVRAEGRAAEA
jgi:hypothetical protein